MQALAELAPRGLLQDLEDLELEQFTAPSVAKVTEAPQQPLPAAVADKVHINPASQTLQVKHPPTAKKNRR